MIHMKNIHYLDKVLVIFISISLHYIYELLYVFILVWSECTYCIRPHHITII